MIHMKKIRGGGGGGKCKVLPSFDDQFAAIKNNGTSFQNVALFALRDMGVMCKIGKIIRTSTKTMHDLENDMCSYTFTFYVCSGWARKRLNM